MKAFLFFPLLILPHLCLAVSQNSGTTAKCQDFLTKKSPAKKNFSWLNNFQGSLHLQQIEQLQSHPLYTNFFNQLTPYKEMLIRDPYKREILYWALKKLLNLLEPKSLDLASRLSEKDFKRLKDQLVQLAETLVKTHKTNQEYIKTLNYHMSLIQSLHKRALLIYQLSIAQSFSRFFLSRHEFKDQLGSKAFKVYSENFKKQILNLLRHSTLSFALQVFLKKLIIMKSRNQLEDVKNQEKVRTVMNTLFLIEELFSHSEKANKKTKQITFETLIESIKYLNQNSRSFEHTFLQGQYTLLKLYKDDFIQIAFKNYLDPTEQSPKVFLSPKPSERTNFNLLELSVFIKTATESLKDLAQVIGVTPAVITHKLGSTRPMSFGLLKKFSKTMDLPFLDLILFNPSLYKKVYAERKKLGLAFPHDGMTLRYIILEAKLDRKDIEKKMNFSASRLSQLLNTETFSPSIIKKLTTNLKEPQIHKAFYKAKLSPKNSVHFQGDYTYPKLRIKEALQERNIDVDWLVQELNLKGRAPELLPYQIKNNSEKISIQTIEQIASFLNLPITKFITLKPHEDSKKYPQKNLALSWIHSEFLSENPFLSQNLTNSPFSLKVLKLFLKKFKTNPFSAKDEPQTFKEYLLALDKLNTLQAFQKQKGLKTNEALNEAKQLFLDSPQLFLNIQNNFKDFHQQTKPHVSKIREAVHQAENFQNLDIALKFNHLLFSQTAFKHETKEQISDYQRYLLDGFTEIGRNTHLSKPWGQFFFKAQKILSHKNKALRIEKPFERIRALLNTFFLSHELLASAKKPLLMDLKTPLTMVLENLDSSLKNFKEAFFDYHLTLQNHFESPYAELFRKNYIDSPGLRLKVLLPQDPSLSQFTPSQLKELMEISSLSPSFLGASSGINPKLILTYLNKESDLLWGAFKKIASTFNIDIIELLSGRALRQHPSRELGLDFPHDGVTFKAFITLLKLKPLDVSKKLNLKNKERIYALFQREYISLKDFEKIDSVFNEKDVYNFFQKQRLNLDSPNTHAELHIGSVLKQRGLEKPQQLTSQLRISQKEAKELLRSSDSISLENLYKVSQTFQIPLREFIKVKKF